MRDEETLIEENDGCFGEEHADSGDDLDVVEELRYRVRITFPDTVSAVL